MKNKEILFDTIVTEYNGEFYTHGEVIYENLMRCEPNEPMLVKANVNFALSLTKENTDAFVDELNKLVQKYTL